MRFSALFSTDIHTAAFDEAIDRDIANGRVNHILRQSLELCYGLAISQAPAAAIKDINELLASETRILLVPGNGAVATSVEVVQSLHQFALDMERSGKVKSLPAILPLPAWADPAAIAAAKAARKVKADQTRAEKKRIEEAAKQAVAQAAAQAVVSGKSTAAAVAEAVHATPGTAGTSTIGMAAHLQASINVVIAALNHGACTQVQIDALRVAVDSARAKPKAADAVNPATVISAEPAPWEPSQADIDAVADVVANAKAAADADADDAKANPFPVIDEAMAGDVATADGVPMLLLPYTPAPAAVSRKGKRASQAAAARKAAVQDVVAA